MSEERNLPALQFYLFGAPRVTWAGRPITGFTSHKVEALLLYLAVTATPHRRAALAALLWPNANEQKAHTSLRKALVVLRKLLPGALLVDRHTVALRHADVWLDTAHFELLLKSATGGDLPPDDPMSVIRQHQAAVSLYGGEFLAGFHVGDAEPFEQWAAARREQFHQTMLAALLLLAQWYADQADTAACLDTLGHLLTLDPGHEAAQRLRMQLLAQTGRRGAAILQFDAHRRYLAEELGVDPAAETAALYDRLLEGITDDPEMPPTSLPPASPPPGLLPEVEWGEMPARITFVGRPKRMAQLLAWLTDDPPSTLVLVSGLGGVGKTALVSELVYRLAEQPVAQHGFARILWRSLVNAPPLAEVVDDWLRCLAQSPAVPLPAGLDARLALLFVELQRTRCLLILDNGESLLGEAGHYRPGYEDYRQLLARMAHGRHRSCLVLTTREAPREMTHFVHDYPTVKTLPLMGLTPDASVQLLRVCGMQGSDRALAELAARYSGNPLAIRLVASTITDLYGGNVESLPADEAPVFGDIRDVLDQHFARLDPLAQSVLTWLAVTRTPMLPEELRAALVVRPSPGALLDAIQTLRRASLLGASAEERSATANEAMAHPVPALLGGGPLELQHVVMEYVTARLLERLLTEVEAFKPQTLHHFGLCNVNAPQYVQEIQGRVLLAPLAQAMVERDGESGALQRLRRLRDDARAQTALRHGYLAANVLHLLAHLQADLTGEDFSHFTLRQADLRRVALHAVNFRHADLATARFADNFGSVMGLATSADGRLLAAGADCDILVWQTQDLRLHQVLRGHTHHVWAIAITPDARHLAATGLDGTLIVWELASGAVVQRLRAPDGTLRAIAFSPDGHHLAGGGEGQRIWLWDWQQGILASTLTTDAAISGLGFVATGELLVSIGYQGILESWDLTTQRRRYTLPGAGHYIQALAISADGAWAIAGSQDAALYVWDLRRLALAGVLQGHAAWVLALSLAPNGEHVASASADGTVCVWHLPTRQLVQRLIGHRGWVRAVAYLRDGHHLVSGGYDQTLRLWQLHDGREARRLQGALRWVNRLVFSPDGEYVAGATLGGDVHLWRGDTLSWLHQMQCDDAPVRDLAFSPDSRWLATSSDAGNVCVWSVAGGKRRYALIGHTHFVRALAFDRRGRYLASGSLDTTLRIWDMTHGTLVRVISQVSANLPHALEFSPTHDVLAYGDVNGQLHVIDPHLGQIHLTLPLSAPVNVLAFAPSGTRLACGAKDGVVTVWDLTWDNQGELTATPRLRIHRSGKRPWRLLFSPDGRYLAWNGDGIDINVVDLEEQPSATGAALYCLSGNHQEFGMTAQAAVALLVATGPDHAVVVHEAATGAVRTRYMGHRVEMTALAVHPAGRAVAVGDTSGMVRLWPLATESTAAATTPLALSTLTKPTAAVKLRGPYYGMNITDATGLSPSQRQTLMELGAVDEDSA